MRRFAWAAAIAAVASLSAGYSASTATASPGGPGSHATRTYTGTVMSLVREQHRGELETVAVPGTEAAKDQRPEHERVIHTGSQVVPLADDSLPQLADGATVSAEVEQPAPTADAEVVSSTTLAKGTTLAGTTAPVTRQVYAAIVVPKGLSKSNARTETEVRAAVSRASSYWMSQTGDRVGFAVAKVLPVYTSAYACGGNSATNMWNEALAKMPEAKGVGRHLLVVATKGAENAGCDYGIATFGSLSAAQNTVFVSDLNQSIVAHELGHNLGRGHSDSLRCKSVQDSTVVSGKFSGCTQYPYYDVLDVMGLSGATFGEGNLNALQLYGMGLLPDAVTHIAANSGVTRHRLVPLSGGLTAKRALRITDANGAVYYVNYRTASGRDAVATKNPFHPPLGVEVLRESPTAPRGTSSVLMDPTPTSLTSADWSRIVPKGGSFFAASGTLTISIESQDASGATIRVNSGVKAQRWSGADRYAASATFSAKTYAAGVPVAYVASGLVFPDALSGAPVAAMNRGPVLLTAPKSIPAAVATELKRLQPQKIVVLGGTGSVSSGVATALKGYATTGSVSRWAGPDRYTTSAAISARSFSPGVPVAYVASGMVFPDALSGAPVAGRTRGPVLLTATKGIPASIAAELRRLKPQKIVVLGGAGSVADSVKTALAGYTTGTVERWAGADRFAASATISQKSVATGAPVAYIANGLNFPDALSGAPIAGIKGGPVLLTRPTSLPAPVVAELKRLKPKKIVVLGGTGSVSSGVQRQLAAYIG